jgi:Bacterial PH domain
MRPHLKYVAPDERIVLESGTHWAVLLRPGFAALLAIVIASVVGFVTSPLEGSSWVDVGAGIFAALFTLRFLIALARWGPERTVVTGTRVMRIGGVLKKRIASTPLDRVASLSFEQPLLGRMLGYATIVLESGWPGRPLARLEAIPAAEAFYRTLTLVRRPGVGSLLEEQVPAVIPPDQADTGPIPRVIL